MLHKYVSPDVRVEGFLSNGKVIEGINNFKDALIEFFNSFLELQFDIDYIHTSAKCVYCHWRAVGYQADDFWSIPVVSDKKIQFDGIFISSIENNRINGQSYFWGISSLLLPLLPKTEDLF